MRGFYGIVALFTFAGCGGPGAEIEGSAGGVDFASIANVYYGGPFVVISTIEADCEGLDFVKRNYEVGQAPTEDETSMLQLSFMDSDDLLSGVAPVKLTASVSASVVRVEGGAFYETIADAGTLTIDEVVDSASATGSFQELTFADGTLNGSFEATWCRNLKAR